ncbi:DNA repair protein Rad4 (macronuclear) [Tetrahymena thermophila SB210]|uniref:DNA repair protein Rad4 n=1 Tax=Tetrahymena thermophila (strain SB210) TaxID=312017 RepID=I7MCE6_TETTS|nr:DNA repair protein Rad4 [Tetrahymena thermophila SB210]EAR83751.1 DNA repair protein Rad4 [Tetrahymena thermophila SB210]|eukprot:XP_001031414.1 DNA repair protein Rad4 [Tetrahymena thermophila SB210]
MDSNEDLDFNDEFEEVDEKQNEDRISFGSDDENNQQKQSDSEDNLYFDNKIKNNKKQKNKLEDSYEDDRMINEDENQDIDFLNAICNKDEEGQKNMREDFLSLIKTAGDDDTIQKLMQERQQLGRTEGGRENPHIIKEQMILEKMLAKQKRYDEIMYEKEKLEFLKKTRKIRQNPEEYRNFIKCFVLCEISSTFYFLQSHLEDEYLKAKIISQFSLKDLNFLLSMKNYPEKYSTRSIIKTVNYHIQQYFTYKWKKEQIEFHKNLDEGIEVGYSQMTLIALILFEFIGMKVRFSKIVDMRYLNLDKKHNSRIKESKRSSNQSQESTHSNQKRTRESIVSSVVQNKRAARFSDMASRITAKIMNQTQMIEDQIDSDQSDSDDEDYQTKKNDKKQQQKESNDLFDQMLSNFKFDKKSTNNSSMISFSNQKKNQQEEDSIVSTASSTFQTDPKKFDFRKYLNKGKKQDDDKSSLLKIDNQTQKQEEEEIKLVNKKLSNLKKLDSLSDVEKCESEVEKEEETLNPFNFAFSKKKFKKTQQDLIQTQQTNQTEQDSKLLENDQNQQQQKLLKSDFYQSSEIKYWLEVYDEKSQQWICFDAVQNEILERFQILLKQNSIPVLFIVGYNKLEFKNEKLKEYVHNKRSMKNLFLFDITDIHCDRYPKIQVSRRELNFDYWWKNLLQHVSFLGNPELLQDEYKPQVISERETKIQMQKSQIPQSYPEFKASEIYITKSMLQKYQGLHPNAQKTNLTFKDEDVYFKEYVVDLHAKTRWRSYQRSVKPDEKPVKQVQSILGNKKMVDLFGFWQTEELVYKIRDDGTLPRNEYGNWETFAGDPPEGTVLIEIQGLPKLLKKHNIEYVEAVCGFESTASGRSHVVKNGILAHKKDEERIRQIYQDNYEIMKAQQAENLKKELMGFWRKIFKGVLLKKSISDRQNKISM